MYVFIGDTGEKDEEAGERIASKYPNKVRAIFLHTVYKENINNNLNKFTDRKVSGVPVFYFRTYIGAAVKAYRSNIIGEKKNLYICYYTVCISLIHISQSSSCNSIIHVNVNTYIIIPYVIILILLLMYVCR